MRFAWSKADPKPTPLVQMAMKKLKVRDLKTLATSEGLDIVSLETALLRLAKDFIKKSRSVRVSLDRGKEFLRF